MDKLKEMSEKKAIVSLNAFFENAFFPFLLGGVVLLLYILNLPIVILAVCGICATLLCLFAKDTRAGLAIFLFTMISFRYKDNGGAYTSLGAILVYATIGPAVLGAALYRLIMRRVKGEGKIGLISMGILCGAMLLGGVFTKYYTAINFANAVGFAGVLFGSYLFFSQTMEKREDNLLYLARICAVAICMISLQVGEFYLRVYEKGTPLDWIWKEKIILGWSISNMVGEMIAMLLPAVFYLIYKEKYGYLYWLVVVAAVVGVYFTFGRNALLWCAIVVLVCSITNCFIGAHKRINRAVVLAAILVFIGLLILLWQTGDLKKITAFFTEAGFKDRDRFMVWEGHLELFKEKPVQGVGFKAYHSIMQGREHNAHNNILQMLTSTGILGLFLYLVHRVQTLYVIIKNRKTEGLFLGGCVLVGILMGIVSSIFFHIYFMAFYSVLLLTLEKSLKSEKE